MRFLGFLVALATLGVALPSLAQQGYSSPAMLPLPSGVVSPQVTYNGGGAVYSATNPWSGAQRYSINPYATQGYTSSYATSQVGYREGTVVDDGATDHVDMAGSEAESCWEDSLKGSCASCSGCSNTCCGPRPAWFGGIGGVVLTRNEPNQVWTTADNFNNFNQMMKLNDTPFDWVPGGAVAFGRQFCGGGAAEVSFWGTSTMAGTALTTNGPGGLVTPIDLTFVDIGGQPASHFFDDANAHQIWRRDNFYNFEVNGFTAPFASPSGSVVFGWLYGLRYFRWNESVIFGSVANGFEFGNNGGLEEAYMNSQMKNSILAFQVGSIANWFFLPTWSVFAMPKFGVGPNWMDSRFSVYRGDGLNAIDVHANRTIASFIGSIDVGLNWAFAPNWSVYGGYRFMAVTGVGTADQQFPHFLVDTPEIATIKPNNNLVLHGIIFGVLCWF
ncbi:MAG: hypothetical protein K2Y37_06425 [Pirellulales bacterium]|nr:hypothetical protein [Pirellulales bacterium]